MKRLGVALALIVAVLAPQGRAAARATNCGARDLPETGLQGEVPLRDQLTGRALRGYNCGLALVGHVKLGGAPANMAWAGHCAYVATSGTGLYVVDVSDPVRPKVTETLRGPGENLTIETIAARQVGNRAVLVAGRYGYFSEKPVTAPMDIYDVSNCAHPKFLTTFRWPENIHNLTISPDLGRVYATLPVQAADIRDPKHPYYLGNIENGLVGGPLDKLGPPQVISHEVQTSADGNTIYIGGQTPWSAGFEIADVTGYPQRQPRLLSRVDGRGHSINIATINGRTYAVHSEESIAPLTAKGCASNTFNPFAGAAQPWLSDVTDPRHPVMRISHMTLAINAKQNCAREVADGEQASVHYHDVDNPQHTTFVLASMWSAGLRVFDVRDPRHPKEAGYFNPGMYLRPSDAGVLDKAWGHVHYDETRGQIWFATQSGGFWVVELEPQLRASLGLPALPVRNPQGRAPRPGSLLTLSAPTFGTAVYCTVNSTLPIARPPAT